MSRDVEEDMEDWEVEKILGVKRNLRKKKVECLIKYKGMPNTKNSWEDLDRLPADKRDLLEPFKEAIDRLELSKRSLDDEEFEDKEMDQDEYVVEDVLGIQWSWENKRIEYFIKWDGWDNSYNNWEPEENMYCPDLIEFFEESKKHLKKTFGKEMSGPASKGRSAPKNRRNVSSDSEESEPSIPKRAGPRSKTVPRPGPASKKPGPKSKTLFDSDDDFDSVPKKPGPKSKTVLKPGPASKKPGPASRVSRSYVDSDDEVSSKRKAADLSDDDESIESRNGKKKNGSVCSEESRRDGQESEDDAPIKKKPGPKSKTLFKPGPASTKEPGPKSRTITYSDEDSD